MRQQIQNLLPKEHKHLCWKQSLGFSLRKQRSLLRQQSQSLLPKQQGLLLLLVLEWLVPEFIRPQLC